MTAKEKAIELMNAMGISISYLTNYTGGDDIPVYTNPYTKKCALVAVNEIYNLDLKVGAYLDTDPDKENYYSYWEDVKAEIGKL